MSFSEAVILHLNNVPAGKVVTYGQLAILAGNPAAARGVVWILRSSSRKYNLPWHRVVAAEGRIALHPGQGREEQISLLAAEGIIMQNGSVNMRKYQWNPSLVYDNLDPGVINNKDTER